MPSKFTPRLKRKKTLYWHADTETMKMLRPLYLALACTPSFLRKMNEGTPCFTCYAQMDTMVRCIACNQPSYINRLIHASGYQYTQRLASITHTCWYPMVLFDIYILTRAPRIHPFPSRITSSGLASPQRLSLDTITLGCRELAARRG